MSVKSRRASSQQVGHAGKFFVVAELSKRGAFVAPFAVDGPPIDIIACNRDKSRMVSIRVTTKRGGKTWHSSIVGCQPMSPKANEDTFWVFVDLGDAGVCPRYWIVPEWWIKDNIYRAHQAYLSKHGGRRPKNPDSTHHSIDESRLEQWKERWDILGIFE